MPLLCVLQLRQGAEKVNNQQSCTEFLLFLFTVVSKLDRCLLLRGQTTVIVGHSTEAAFGELEALLCGKTNS